MAGGRPSLSIGRHKIANRRVSSSNLCIICRLAQTPLNGSESSQRLASSFSGSRGLHAGSPAKRPPSESQSTSSRTTWARPTFDDSMLNAFLKARREGTEGHNLPNLSKTHPDEMGKWARPAPRWNPEERERRTSSAMSRQKDYDGISNQLRSFNRQETAPAPDRTPFGKTGFNSAQSRDQPRAPNNVTPTSALPRNDLTNRQSSGKVQDTESSVRKSAEHNVKTEMSTQSAPPPPPPSNPYAEVVKSRRSAADIENDLFAGINTEPAKLESSRTQAQTIQSSPMDSFLSSFGKEDSLQSTARTPFQANTSYTKASQPFKVSQRSVQDAMEAAKKSQERRGTTSMGPAPERPLQQFGFMSARMRPSAFPAQNPVPVPQATRKLEPEAPENVKRVSSAEWHSSSREQWSYDIDTKHEDKLAAEAQQLVDIATENAAETLTPEQVKVKKRGEISTLRRKAKAKKFLVNMEDLGIWEEQKTKVEALPDIKVEKNLYIPKSISVVNFADLLKIPLGTLQKKMELLGLEPEQCTYDYVLNDEMASLIALEFGYEPHVDASAAFDLFPQPVPADMSKVPLRPPIVTIMGHVDHGKTTLLDTLRKSSVAANEAGGITQHIGAFSVSLSSGENITFLDTPGHAAFLTMRERGATVTDIVVLVVAADDGVMPQTIEAINHAKNANVPIIVALNKCDREDADPAFVKSDLLANGVELEEFGGDVQCVEVSGLTGDGLDMLEAAIITLAEVLEMRAPKDGLVEGWIIESTVDPGRGTYTTVLVKRGTLKPGDLILAGTTYAKVRRMITSTGKSIKQATPGTPVEVTGWKERPNAGDQVLQASNESDAKLAIRNRIIKKENLRDQAAIETINERRLAARREFWQQREKKLVAEEIARSGQTLPGIIKAEENTGPKTLRVVIKADVGGSAEAVEEAIKDLGNSEVKVEVVDTSVGEITESDLSLAIAADAKILGFNIRSLNPNLRSQVAVNNVEIFYHSIIYKLIDDVIARLESMLAPKIEISVTGEAEVTEIFDVTIKGKKKPVAGSKVFNGTISIKEKCRITRGGRIVYSGKLDTLRHFKDDVKEVRKGTECGLSFEDYNESKIGDTVQSYKEIEVKRKLYG